MGTTQPHVERPLGVRAAAWKFITQRITLRPLRERRLSTLLALVCTVGFLSTLLTGTAIEVSTGRQSRALTSSAVAFALTAGLFTVLMHNWPSEIRRPLLLTLLELATGMAFYFFGYTVLFATAVVVNWFHMPPVGIPLVSSDQIPRTVALGVLCVLATIGAIVLQRYAYRQLRLAMGRCSKCEYRLFGLTSPRCPECGTPFDPSKISHIDAGAL